MHGYAQKAAREAKTHTSWTTVNAEYEQALHNFIQSMYQDHDFLAELEELVQKIADAGYANSLGQTLLKLTCPGIPDIYQGTELWDFSLVDPDNRRPVDYSLRRTLLDAHEKLSAQEIMNRIKEGLPKLQLIRQGLQLRHQMPETFGPAGSYEPIQIAGTKAAHALAYVRGGRAASLLTRLPFTLNDWADTTLSLPEGTWRNVLTNRTLSGGILPIAQVLHPFPVALLVLE
jgi:(1->4)-alpha-D-glucan 1-alpha-D-glucosylmutase